MAAVTGGLLACLALVGGSAATARQAASASAAQPNAGAAAVLLVRRFGVPDAPCKIGRIGADPCGKTSYGVLAGKYVRVALEASGGKKIEFKIYSTRTGNQLGKQSLEPGDRKTIWTNHTNRRVNVRFTADASGIVNTLAKGKFLFGPY